MAAYFVGKAASVSVVGRSAVPYIATLGETIGKALLQVSWDREQVIITMIELRTKCIYAVPLTCTLRKTTLL